MTYSHCMKALEGDLHHYSLMELEKSLGKDLSTLPVSIRIMLESLLRNEDGKKIQAKDIEGLANWNAKKPSESEVPFIVSRVILQDFTGVPLLVDLAAMRSAVEAAGKDASLIEPIVPVDLVVDHSVQVDKSGTDDAFMTNLKVEFERNKERYSFLKWGQQAFKTLKSCLLVSVSSTRSTWSTLPLSLQNEKWMESASSSLIPWLAPTLIPP